MIWNGIDPLQPDHEVAYRGWPTERVALQWESSVAKEFLVTCDGLSIFYNRKGEYFHDAIEDDFDLIPLQQEQP